MQPLVMDEKLYEELKGDYSYRDAMELLDNINNAIKLGNIENVSQLTEELFLHRLKYAFDFSLCRDVIGEIKRLVYRYSTIYDHNPHSSFLVPHSEIISTIRVFGFMAIAK